MITRTESLFDSSRISEIPTIFFSRTRSAIFVTRLALLSPYGISDTLINFRHFLFSSMFATPRTITDPLPVEYAVKRASLS